MRVGAPRLENESPADQGGASHDSLGVMASEARDGSSVFRPLYWWGSPTYGQAYPLEKKNGARGRVKDGGKIIELVRFKITAAGRRALQV